jgi:quinol monooxygenase YgiN
MYVRTIVADLIPRKADEAVKIFREQIVPVIREQPGFVSTSIYIDRSNNQAQTISVWESEAAAKATSEGTAYLAKVTGMLRSCLVNRKHELWEIAYTDSV